MRMWILGGVVLLGGHLWRQLSQIERGEVRLGGLETFIPSYIHHGVKMANGSLLVHHL